MTGDEMLDSGVQVMAQPPGKKNPTIHLLSGGEKALTAIPKTGPWKAPTTAAPGP